MRSTLHIPDIGRLRDEHARLIETLGRLESALARPTPPPAMELFALRRELTAALVGHLKTEDWMLYPALLAGRDKQLAAKARTMVEEMGGLAADFASFSDAWGATEIARDWAGYRRAGTAMIGALAKRIARENSELYPMLEEAGRKAA
jgi:iron-sulfur cluster repair protein YtfE (RIC family)